MSNDCEHSHKTYYMTVTENTKLVLLHVEIIIYSSRIIIRSTIYFFMMCLMYLREKFSPLNLHFNISSGRHSHIRQI